MNDAFSRRELFKLAAAPLIRASTLSAQPASAHLKAGTAKIDITPDRPRLCASGDKPDPPAAYARLHSRVLTLFDGARRIVFVNYDLNCLDVATPILRERVERELGIPPPYLVLLATHNHQGPIQIAASNFDYGRELAEKIFGAIHEAITDEDGPVDLLFGQGYAYLTRTQRSYPPDYELQVLKVMRGGRVAALLFNYPTHPQLGPRKVYGASHPGFAMEELEEKVPGAVAIYADACGGNQYTLAPEGTTDFLAACKARGHQQPQAALEIANGKLEEIGGPIESRLELIDLPLDDPIPYHRALELARDVPMKAGLRPFPDPLRDTNWIRQLVRHYKESIPFPKRISVLSKCWARNWAGSRWSPFRASRWRRSACASKKYCGNAGRRWCSAISPSTTSTYRRGKTCAWICIRHRRCGCSTPARWAGRWMSKRRC